MIPESVARFLPVPTPDAWVAEAARNIELLLIDHANCEKKAASTAVSLLYRYVGETDLLQRLSRLAREELRHFEQVVAVMAERGIEYRQLTASRYARQLHEEIRSEEPGRLVDTLVVAAIVEARSCERFALLAEVLPADLGSFYARLLASEARHFETYMRLAAQYADAGEIEMRVGAILRVEQELVTSFDESLRFHSGPTATREG